MTASDPSEDIMLFQCDENGAPVGFFGDAPAELQRQCAGGAELYRRIGFTPPWVNYLAARGQEAVGGGAFVGAPDGGEVEIAYFTLEALQGQGVGRGIAAGLVQIAELERPDLTLTAKTLPTPGPSTRILEHLGFARAGTAMDADEGEVWLWRRAPGG